MLETLILPKNAERKPWEMFLVGMIYAAFSILFVNWIFLNNPVFTEYASILIITFTVILSVPFMYYTIKYEERKDTFMAKERALIKEHGKALVSFLFLFLGFLVAFSVAFIILPQDIAAKDFKIQVGQYCTMNMPNNYQTCVAQYSGVESAANSVTGEVTGDTASEWNRVLSIFENNIFVLIFCIISSLAFGAGAIFILTWNASVIAAAIGIFAKSSIAGMPLAFLRYMVHGLPEIAAYFIAGLAGGIISAAVISNDFTKRSFWHILLDFIDMLIIAILVLGLAALTEVFITPALF